MKVYVFMSFGSIHTRKNLGCCIVKVKKPENANDECKRLGLMPNECNEGRGYVMDETGFKEQGMELNKFYTRNEMIGMGFQI